MPRSATRDSLWSTPIAVHPREAKNAIVGKPSFPSPMTDTFSIIDFISLFGCKDRCSVQFLWSEYRKWLYKSIKGKRKNPPNDQWALFRSQAGFAITFFEGFGQPMRCYAGSFRRVAIAQVREKLCMSMLHCKAIVSCRQFFLARKGSVSVSQSYRPAHQKDAALISISYSYLHLFCFSSRTKIQFKIQRYHAIEVLSILCTIR